MTGSTEDTRTLEEIKEAAKTDGRRKGKEAVENCEIEHNKMTRRWKETGAQEPLRDALLEEAHLAENNGRQYSGHPIYEIDQLDLDEGWKYGEVTRAYEEGVSEGIKEGLEERMEREIASYRATLTAEDALETLREARRIEVLGTTLDARHLFGYFEEMDTTLDEMRRVVKVWEGEEMVGSDLMYHKLSRYEATLRAFSDAVGFHGVETVRDGRSGPVLYDYANSGDTVIPTLHWMHEAEVWVLGDFETIATLGDPRLFHKRNVEI